MSTLSKEFLQSIGIELDDTAYPAFTEHFDTTLSTRIINEIIDSLDETQIAQFNQLQSADSNQLWEWVRANVPELSDIIQDEINILLGELAENSDQI